MQPVIDHIQITVKDIKQAEKFYDKLMPILGFDLAKKVSATIQEHDLYVVEYLIYKFSNTENVFSINTFAMLYACVISLRKSSLTL